MKKIIDIPDDVKISLSVLAAKAGKDLKNYIQDLLIAHVQARGGNVY